MALDGVIEYVHALRWHRYLEHRDNKREGEAKWFDNTLRFSAEVYNGGLQVIGRYAHTARVIYDKHWDGRNRTKSPSLSEEAHAELEACHLCGGVDSQAHAFRWCSHSNISAIRQEVRKSLDEYVSNLRLKPLDRDTRETRKQQVILAEGVIQELYSCRDASRGWTGNWDNEMIRRVEKRAGIDRLDKRQCLALREILKDMYEVISQGGNDILEVRHTLQDIQRQYVA